MPIFIYFQFFYLKKHFYIFVKAPLNHRYLQFLLTKGAFFFFITESSIEYTFLFIKIKIIFYQVFSILSPEKYNSLNIKKN